jgi:hypothetical protein
VLTFNFIAFCVDSRAAKAARFSTFEKVAAIGLCPLRLCVFAFQMPFGCGSAALGPLHFKMPSGF